MSATPVTLSFSGSYANDQLVIATTATAPTYPINAAHLTFTVNGVSSTNALTIPGRLSPGYHLVTVSVLPDEDWTVTAPAQFEVYVADGVPVQNQAKASQTIAAIGTLFVLGVLFLR